MIFKKLPNLTICVNRDTIVLRIVERGWFFGYETDLRWYQEKY